MSDSNTGNGLIMRLFHVHTKTGQAARLLKQFATTSADVVQHEPGNKGYFFGQGIALNENIVVFASLWSDLNAIKKRFGDDWQVSFLPEGYEELIEACSVQHIDIGAGWYVEPRSWLYTNKYL